MRQPTLNATAQSLVQRVWGYATVLRDDGVGYGDYVEQITYLLFLKMADEQAGAPNAPGLPVKSPNKASFKINGFSKSDGISAEGNTSSSNAAKDLV